MYDSATDTLRHIRRVNELLAPVIGDLAQRAAAHDTSKLIPPEKPVFDQVTPLLAGTTYGSPDYQKQLDTMGAALDHHYTNNPHHPEFHQRGIVGMTLMDLLEMLADWRAASERHTTGSMVNSLRINAVRFQLPDGLLMVLWQTARAQGWLDRPECGRPFAAPDGTRMFCTIPADGAGWHEGLHADGTFDGGQVLWDDAGHLAGGWRVVEETVVMAGGLVSPGTGSPGVF